VRVANVGFNPASLQGAELVLLHGQDLALAIGYNPGQTPIVSAKSHGPASQELLWCAQELAIPLIESAELSAELVDGVQEGEDIPEPLFRPAAQALALVMRNATQPAPVKLVRTLSNTKSRASQKLQKRVDQLLEQLEISQVLIKLGPGVDAVHLAPLLTLHRHRLQVESGIPFNEPLVEYDPGLEAGQFQILVLGTLEGEGLVDDDDFGRLLHELYLAVARSGWRLIGYRETELLLEATRKRHKRLVAAIYPHRLSLGCLRQVLRNLLKEGLPIRDFSGILEVLSENLDRVFDPEQLTELVRGHFARELCRRVCDKDGVVHALLVDPLTEQKLLHQIRQTTAALWLDLDVDSSLKLLSATSRAVEQARKGDYPLVVLTSPRPRRFLRRLLEPTFPYLPVLSYAEISALTEVITVGMLSL
jgi:type III secretion system FlhB-like substrate exporter